MTGGSFKIRNFSDQDFDRYVQLRVEAEQLAPEGRFVSARSLSDALGHPKFKAQRDLWVAEMKEILVGCLSIQREPEIGRALLSGCVHPDHRRKKIGTKLLSAALAQIKAAGIKSAQVSIGQTHSGAKKMLIHSGFSFIRNFFEMQLAISRLRLPAIREANISSRRLLPGEVSLLTQIQNRCFAGSWGFNANTEEEIAYRLKMQGRSSQDVILTYLGEHPIGYCWTLINSEENKGSKKNKGLIHMLGVDPDFRRQDVGKAILINGLADLKARGVDIVELTVDCENSAARALYESVGFEMVAKTEWYEKLLNSA
ncbi:MAG: GNAT family N-acetyltransferase [Desulfobacterales bacterium]|nr:GNAT family N-acetyltransferase [Desulfobacterales bacterium]